MGRTYDSIPEAFKDLNDRTYLMASKMPQLERILFLGYYNYITPNVPIKTGYTRSFPSQHRPTNFSRNIMEWSPVYLSKIYYKNKTGIPQWDIVTANNINDKMSTITEVWLSKYLE